MRRGRINCCIVRCGSALTINRFRQNVNRKAQTTALAGVGAGSERPAPKAAAAVPKGSVENKGLTPHGKPKQKNLPCFACMGGQCALKGKDCQLSHAQDVIDKAVRTSSKARPKGGPRKGIAATSGSDGEGHTSGTDAGRRKSTPCRFFLKGVCNRGSNCAYSHESTSGKAAAASPTKPAVAKAAAKAKAKAAATELSCR